MNEDGLDTRISHVESMIRQRLSPFGSVNDIESRMKPGQFSSDGFLGPTEDLLELMIQDQITVEQLGITHEQIAEPLQKVTDMMSRALYDRSKELRTRVLELNNKRFLLVLDTYHHYSETATQKNPFTGDSDDSGDIQVYDISGMDERLESVEAIQRHFAGEYPIIDYTGCKTVQERREREVPLRNYNASEGYRKYYQWWVNKLVIPFVLPKLVAMGFYEGMESPYRLDPKRIVDFFNIPHK